MVCQLAVHIPLNTAYFISNGNNILQYQTHYQQVQNVTYLMIAWKQSLTITLGWSYVSVRRTPLDLGFCFTLDAHKQGQPKESFHFFQCGCCPWPLCLLRQSPLLLGMFFSFLPCPEKITNTKIPSTKLYYTLYLLLIFISNLLVCYTPLKQYYQV